MIQNILFFFYFLKNFGIYVLDLLKQMEAEMHSEAKAPLNPDEFI